MSIGQNIFNVTSFCVQPLKAKDCIAVEWEKPVSLMLDAMCRIKNCSFVKEFSGTIASSSCALICSKKGVASLSLKAKALYEVLVKNGYKAPAESVASVITTADRLSLNFDTSFFMSHFKSLANQTHGYTDFAEYFSDGKGVARDLTFLSSLNDTFIQRIGGQVTYLLPKVVKPMENITNSIPDIVNEVKVDMPWAFSYKVGAVAVVLLGVIGTACLVAHKRAQIEKASAI